MSKLSNKEAMAGAEPPSCICRKKSIISIRNLFLSCLDSFFKVLIWSMNCFINSCSPGGSAAPTPWSTLCLKFRIELENYLTDLIINIKTPNRGFTHRARGHAINVVGPYFVYAILIRTIDCICPHHILINRWAILSAILNLLSLLGPSAWTQLTIKWIKLDFEKGIYIYTVEVGIEFINYIGLLGALVDPLRLVLLLSMGLLEQLSLSRLSVIELGLHFKVIFDIIIFK